MRHVLDVARMQAVNRTALVYIPLSVLVVAFVSNLLIFAALADVVPPADRITGALLSIYLGVAVTHLATMTQGFPLALGLSVTRRSFFAATAVVVVAQAAVLGLVLTVMERVEEATDGWGLQLSFFGLGLLAQPDPVAQWAVYATPLATAAVASVLVGVLFKRLGPSGLVFALIGKVAVLALAAAWVGRQGWWPAIGAYLAGRSVLTLAVACPLAIGLVLGGVAWLVLRRAVP